MCKSFSRVNDMDLLRSYKMKLMRDNETKGFAKELLSENTEVLCSLASSIFTSPATHIFTHFLIPPITHHSARAKSLVLTGRAVESRGGGLNRDKDRPFCFFVKEKKIISFRIGENSLYPA